MDHKNSQKILIAIIFLALGLRLISLNQSLWMDEAISATVARDFSLKGIITSFIYSDTHPPLYYLILHLWTSLFGFSETALRMPSVIFGVLTVLSVYKIGSILDKKTGIYAGLLMALSPLHIYYSQEVRMYALTTFLVSISAYYLLKKKWLIFSIFILLLAMSDYLPLVIIIPFGIWEYCFGSSKREKGKFVLSLLPLFIFLLWWLPVFRIQTQSTGSFLVKFPAWRSVLGGASIKELALVWIKFIIGRIGFSNRLLYLAVVALPSTVYLYILSANFKLSAKRTFFWLWLILPVVIIFIGSIKVPGFNYFRLLFTLPAFTLLLAAGVSHKKNTLLLISPVIVGLVFSVVYLSDSTYWREDWKSMVPFVEANLKPGESVLVSYFEPFTPYLWYANEKNRITTFDGYSFEKDKNIYTLDYLMDLTDRERKNYQKLVNLGFREEKVYNFRGVGQVRYWIDQK